MNLAARFAGLALTLATTLFTPLLAQAQDWPAKQTIRFIVVYPPGGASDVTARLLATKLTESLGQSVVVENKPGANGIIATEFVAKSAPDGYTLLMANLGPNALNPVVYKKLPYDPIKDFNGVTLTTIVPQVILVNPNLPVKSVPELIAYAKANPGKVNQGSSGTGALQHFAGEMLAYQSGVKFTHVPYKGGAASLAAVMAGEVQMSFTTLLSARPHMASGKIRILGITAGKRSPAIPDIPTIAEAGVPGFEANQWYGVITSGKVPMPIVNKLSAMLKDAVNSPDVVERLSADGSTPLTSTPAQFAAHISSEIIKWRKLVKDAGLQMN
jgi:tripartite-type tricarboxylate transporter receptor subunit TctC